MKVKLEKVWNLNKMMRMEFPLRKVAAKHEVVEWVIGLRPTHSRKRWFLMMKRVIRVNSRSMLNEQKF